MNRKQWASLGAVGLLLIAGGAAWAFSTRAGAQVEKGTTTHKVKRVAAGPGVWDGLRKRPMALPKLAPGETCLVTKTAKVLPDRYLSGNGPIYPTADTENIPFSLRRSPDGVVASKLGWLASQAYRGPALIRGGQLDGPNELLFGEGPNPPRELEFQEEEGLNVDGLPDGWRLMLSTMAVKAPGCYAWQIDGLDFRTVIIFKVEQ